MFKCLTPLELVFHLLLGVKAFVDHDLDTICFLDFNLQALDELGLPRKVRHKTCAPNITVRLKMTLL